MLKKDKNIIYKDKSWCVKKTHKHHVVIDFVVVATLIIEGKNSKMLWLKWFESFRKLFVKYASKKRVIAVLVELNQLYDEKRVIIMSELNV